MQYEPMAQPAYSAFASAQYATWPASGSGYPGYQSNWEPFSGGQPTSPAYAHRPHPSYPYAAVQSPIAMPQPQPTPPYPANAVHSNIGGFVPAEHDVWSGLQSPPHDPPRPQSTGARGHANEYYEQHPYGDYEPSLTDWIAEQLSSLEYQTATFLKAKLAQIPPGAGITPAFAKDMIDKISYYGRGQVNPEYFMAEFGRRNLAQRPLHNPTVRVPPPVSMPHAELYPRTSRY